MLKNVSVFPGRIKLPCHVVGQRVLFYSSSTAIVHSNTAHHIIQVI